MNIVKKISKILTKLSIILCIVPIVIAIRIIRPVVLIRFGNIRSSRIGHFVANVEMYLCESDAHINKPQNLYIDIFFFDEIICNKQIARMWTRELNIWNPIIAANIFLVNKIIPGGSPHIINHNTCEDRDVHNLLDRFPAHLKFTRDEEKLGRNTIIAMGIPINAKFICLNVRDSAYLAGDKWNYHNYRDSDVKNYILAAEMLADRGFYVIRMGAKVHSAIESKNPRIIDYANNGMRNDFMDIYLGANCYFCITSGSGWDALPENFRRPVVFVNFVPIAGIHTYRDAFLTISKRHLWQSTQQEMTLQEIFTTGVCSFSRTNEYDSNGIELIENTPEEIRDVVIEMADRLEGNFSQDQKDIELQCRFWELFSKGIEMKYSTKVLHGEIRGRFGSSFLRRNQDWLK